MALYSWYRSTSHVFTLKWFTCLSGWHCIYYQCDRKHKGGVSDSRTKNTAWHVYEELSFFNSYIYIYYQVFAHKVKIIRPLWDAEVVYIHVCVCVLSYYLNFTFEDKKIQIKFFIWYLLSEGAWQECVTVYYTYYTCAVVCETGKRGDGKKEMCEEMNGYEVWRKWICYWCWHIAVRRIVTLFLTVQLPSWSWVWSSGSRVTFSVFLPQLQRSQRDLGRHQRESKVRRKPQDNLLSCVHCSINVNTRNHNIVFY